MKPYDADVPDRLDLSELTVSVFGLGKMGLPLAGVLADRGATVRGVDVDESVVRAIEAGECPVNNEPGLPELVAEYGGDRLRATTDGPAAAAAADVHVVLVPTVVDENHEPIMEPVHAVAADIAAGVDPGDLVVLESTVPPGTTGSELAEALATDDLTPGEEFGLAYCPERTSSGRVIRDLTESYPKVVGGVDDASTRAAAALYRAFNEPGVIEVSDATAAEAVKVFEGVYRDVNIALANELAVVCEEWGIDSHEVFEAANTQPYCDIHVPGIGVGGHCIPVYPYFVTTRTDGAPLVETARRVNDGMPAHTVSLVESLLAGHGRDLADATVLVLGITYRPGVEETRYAPALEAITLLNDAGATVHAHDPLLDADRIRETGAIPVADPLDVDPLDAVVLATGHETYADLDLDGLADGMRTDVFVDGRRFFDPGEMTPFTYATVGDGRHNPPRTRKS